jgi:alkylation response protein AidB-like acyl-CoA dehydrogenase/predicted heme/steroid binding protein
MEFTLEEVSKHNTAESAYVIIHGKVYDLTNFMEIHPGGKNVIMRAAGKDVTEEFDSLHEDIVLSHPKYAKLCIGKVVGQNEEPPAAIPFADPLWLVEGLSMPYYTEKHRRWRAKVRAFVDKELLPFVASWDEKGEYPQDIIDKMHAQGLLAPNWPAEYGGTPPEGGWDDFMTLVHEDELARCACGGFLSSARIFGIGLPCVLRFGSEDMKRRVAPRVLAGQAVHALAITEPYGGSDVANLRCSAALSEDGTYYVVTGEKKFITGGMKADFFTVAVRTGPQGFFGVSLLLLEKGMPGLNVRRMKTQGWRAGNTAYVTMDHVRVPVANLIGQENMGFRYIMVNFNGERMGLCIQANRFARVCLEEAIKFARKRVTFGIVFMYAYNTQPLIYRL